MDDLQRKINELEAEIDSLRSSTTIPFEIGGAFEERIGALKGSPSSESTTSHIRAVDEGGMATYNVAKPMDGFITIVVNNIPYKIPYYN